MRMMQLIAVEKRDESEWDHAFRKHRNRTKTAVM